MFLFHLSRWSGLHYIIHTDLHIPWEKLSCVSLVKPNNARGWRDCADISDYEPPANGRFYDRKWYPLCHLEGDFCNYCPGMRTWRKKSMRALTTEVENSLHLNIWIILQRTCSHSQKIPLTFHSPLFKVKLTGSALLIIVNHKRGEQELLWS